MHICGGHSSDRNLGCSGQLEGKFREEGFEKVGELVEAGVVDKDLKELGVKKLKARKTLLRALQMGAGGKEDL